MKNLKFIYVFFLIVFCSNSYSQIILTADEFIEQVKLYHPVIKKSNLIPVAATSKVLQAKSSFDPVIASALENKTLKDLNYYDNSDVGIKWNTNSPIVLSTGLENNFGNRINPENTLGTISYFGIEVPILKGLLTDERRTALGQAKLMLNLSEIERKIQINELLFNAYKSYNDWLTAYNERLILDRYISNIEERLKLTRVTFQNGDKSLADTIEVYTQLQLFKIEREVLIQELVNKTLTLSSFLWNDKGEAYLLAENYIPDINFSNDIINEHLPQFLFENNEWLKIYDYKNRALKLEEKLFVQSQLPSLNLQAKSFGIGDALPFSSDRYPLSQNFYLGLNIKYPFLAREAKSKVQLTRVKLTENELERRQKIWDLKIKFDSALNEWTRLSNQLFELRSLKSNLNKLLELETLRFNQGESSVFVINSRENKLFETQIKENEILKKLVESRLKMRYINITFL